MLRYTVSALVGEGSFGRVYKATRKEDEQTVAIKVISKRGRSSRELKNIRRECDIQEHLKHPNVIEMLESFETRNDLVVVTEFAWIDLHRFLAHNGAMQEDRAQILIADLVSALYYLHSNRILHRDLKPQNVLLNEDLSAKLCDFGLARNMTMGTHVLTSIKGTPLYMAPELLAERPYDHQADLWSLGCISYECIAGQPPFCTTSILHLVKMIKYDEVKWPSFLSSDCRSFLQGLLEKDASMRISWAQILCHPFVDGKLYVSGINAKNSPFTNPQQSKEKVKTADHLDVHFSSMKLTDASSLADNLTTSRDSINAIPPSDMENLETDIEENLNRFTVPFANLPPSKAHSPSRLAENPTTGAAELGTSPQQNAEGIAPSEVETIKSATKSQLNASVKKSRNKDLEKRKLSQNLDNFSLRLGHSIDSETQRKATEMLVAKKEKEKEKEKERDQKCQISIKNSTQSVEEKQCIENSPPSLHPGWDSCDESQSPPIENDEWLAFLHRSMQEVLDGELDSLKQQNLVSIIVAPLRNTKAIPKVIESVAQLLSLPFVLCEPNSVLDTIKTVYVDVKLVPNLMYASKLLICQKSILDSSTSTQHSQSSRIVRTIAELSAEEIQTASHLYELICHLVHLKQQFLSQFCDAVAILAANELLINFLAHDFQNSHATRISNCVIALLCCVLRELPENAELVEKVVFNPKVNLLALLENKDDLLRTRMCMLLRLLVRFCLRALQATWSSSIKHALEGLADDANAEVREAAESTLADLRKFSFYS